MFTAAPTHPESQENFATARRFAWLLHPWNSTVPLNGSLPQQECWPAIIRELSANGAQLMLRREFSAGAVVELHLHTQDRGRVRWLPATVVELRPLDGEARGGRWLLVCNFFEPLTADELRTLQAADAQS